MSVACDLFKRCRHPLTTREKNTRGLIKHDKSGIFDGHTDTSSLFASLLEAFHLALIMKPCFQVWAFASPLHLLMLYPYSRYICGYAPWQTVCQTLKRELALSPGCGICIESAEVTEASQPLPRVPRKLVTTSP